MKRALTICILILSSTLMHAQYCVTGKVADAVSNMPEPAAVVQVFVSDTTASNLKGYALSDSLGTFKINFRGKAGEYILQIVNLGRKTVAVPFQADRPAIDLGTVLLEDDTRTLSSSKVTAARALIKMEADKIGYDVGNDPDSKASTVLEMLRKVPMVTVDGQDNITVNGSSSFKVYVDGKPNQMLSSNPSQIFKSMPASSVQSIEVITNPGAKYDAEGTGGVLNLITARSTTGSPAIPDGANGSISAGVNSKGAMQGGLYFNAKKDKLTIGGNLNAGKQRYTGISHASTQESSDGISLVSSADNMTQDAHMVFGDLNASYDLDSLNLFSASLGVEHWQYESSGLLSFQGLFNGAPLFGYDSDNTSGGHQTGLNTSIDWQHYFAGNKEKTFTLSYRYAKEPEYENNENIFSNITGTSVQNRKIDGKDSSSEHTLQADLTTPIAQGHSLSTGTKLIYRHNHSDEKFYLDDGSGYQLADSDDNYHHYNYIGSLYAEYSGTFGDFSLKSGLRYEYTWQTINYSDGRSFDSKYGNLVPNLTLQYNISQIQNLGLTYNLRIRRPGIGYLCPFIDRASPTSLSYGNPGIEPGKTHSAALKYNYSSPKFMANFSLSYKYGEGGISAYSFYGPDPEDASVSILQKTYGNIIRTGVTGLNWFINWNPVKDTRLYSSMNAGYYDFFSRILDQSNSGISGFMMIGAQQTIPWELRLSANVFGSLRRYNLQGWSSGFSGASLGISKAFLEERLNVSLRAFSNLDKGDATFKEHTKGDGFETSNISHMPLRQIGIELSWNFGKNNFQVKKASRTITNDDVINAENAMQQQNGQTNMQ